MQIVEVTTAKHLLKPVVVLRVTGNKCLCLFSQKASEPWPLSYHENTVVESLEDLRKNHKPKQIVIDQQVYNYEYLTINFETISRFYSNLIEISKLQFVSNNSLNEKQLKLIVKEFQSIRVLKEEETKRDKKLESTK